MIDVAGEVVGQVNGLAVYSLGDHMFGKPSRITASTAMGRAQADGTYPKETINFLVDRKLKKLAEGIKKFGGGPGNIDQGQ